MHTGLGSSDVTAICCDLVVSFPNSASSSSYKVLQRAHRLSIGKLYSHISPFLPHAVLSVFAVVLQSLPHLIPPQLASTVIPSGARQLVFYI